MIENTDTFKKKIEKQRKKLKKTVDNLRLVDKEVQQESEKLDKLINQYLKQL